jgi:quercetin dioxygenase-like cupin family protein
MESANMNLFPKLIPPGSGEVLRAFGDELTVKLGAAQTGGAFALCEDVTPPGGGPPLHFHLHEDELFIVQEGTVEFWLNDVWHPLATGGVAFAPRGKVHTFRNVGETPCKQWILTTPAGFETFFARCGAEFARPAGPEMKRIFEISSEHGIHFVK